MSFVERRDRFLAALIVREPSLALVRSGVLCLLLDKAATQRILVLAIPDTASVDEAQRALLAHIERAASLCGSLTHVIAVGGSSDVTGALRAVAPSFDSTIMGFHHVDAHGRYLLVAGQPHHALEDTCASLDLASPLDPNILADAVARGLVFEEQREPGWLRTQATMLANAHATFLIAIACVSLFAFMLWCANGNTQIALFRLGLANGPAVRSGQVWRLLNSAFLHFDYGHIALNMLALITLGPALELLLGRARYVTLYLTAGLVGSTASALLSPRPAFSAGASGAIWGVMMGWLILAFRPRGLMPPALAQSYDGACW